MKISRPVVLALSSSCLSLLLTFGYIRSRLAFADFLKEPVLVLRAKSDILEGTLLDESHIETKRIPREFLQPGALASLDEIRGMVLAAPILKGEQILGTKLAALSAKSGLSVKIPLGARALSLEVDDVSGVAGLIRPNDFVDLLATFELKGLDDTDSVMTQTLAQRVLVLAVGENLGGGSKVKRESGALFAEGISAWQKRTVTLALPPKQVQEIELAKQKGILSLALRTKWEEEPIDLKPTRIIDLIGSKLKSQRDPFLEYRGGR